MSLSLESAWLCPVHGILDIYISGYLSPDRTMRGGGQMCVTTWQWWCGQPSRRGQFEHSSTAAAGHGKVRERVGAAAGHGEAGERGGAGDQHPAAVQLLHPAPAAAGPGPGQAGDSAGPRSVSLNTVLQNIC